MTKRPVEADYTSHVAYTRALEAYCDGLEQPAVEPVAWRYQDARGNYRYRGYVNGFDKDYWMLKPVPLYTAPQAQTSTDVQQQLRLVTYDEIEKRDAVLRLALERLENGWDGNICDTEAIELIKEVLE